MLDTFSRVSLFRLAQSRRVGTHYRYMQYAQFRWPSSLSATAKLMSFSTRAWREREQTNEQTNTSNSSIFFDMLEPHKWSNQLKSKREIRKCYRDSQMEWISTVFALQIDSEDVGYSCHQTADQVTQTTCAAFKSTIQQNLPILRVVMWFLACLLFLCDSSFVRCFRVFCVGRSWKKSNVYANISSISGNSLFLCLKLFAVVAQRRRQRRLRSVDLNFVRRCSWVCVCIFRPCFFFFYFWTNELLYISLRTATCLLSRVHF